MKESGKKFIQFLKDIYFKFGEIDKESFAPIAAIMAMGIYFAAIFFFRPWSYGGISGSERGGDLAVVYNTFDIFTKAALLSASGLAIIITILARFRIVPNSLQIAPLLLFVMGFTGVFLAKMRDYGNFYLNVEVFYLAIFFIIAFIFMFTGYGEFPKSKALIFLYAISIVALFAAFIKPMIMGDGSELIASIRDLVPHVLVFLFYALTAHGLLIRRVKGEAEESANENKVEADNV